MILDRCVYFIDNLDINLFLVSSEVIVWASKRPNECSLARERSKKRRASEWVSSASDRVNGEANVPVLDASMLCSHSKSLQRISCLGFRVKLQDTLKIRQKYSSVQRVQEWLREWASKWVSSAEHMSEWSSAEQINEWAGQASGWARGPLLKSQFQDVLIYKALVKFNLRSWYLSYSSVHSPISPIICRGIAEIPFLFGQS